MASDFYSFRLHHLGSANVSILDGFTDSATDAIFYEQMPISLPGSTRYFRMPVSFKFYSSSVPSSVIFVTLDLFA